MFGEEIVKRDCVAKKGVNKKKTHVKFLSIATPQKKNKQNKKKKNVFEQEETAYFHQGLKGKHISTLFCRTAQKPTKPITKSKLGVNKNPR